MLIFRILNKYLQAYFADNQLFIFFVMYLDIADK